MIRSAKLYCNECGHILVVGYFVEEKLNQKQVSFELFDCARKTLSTPVVCPGCKTPKLHIETRPAKSCGSMQEAFVRVCEKFGVKMPVPDPMPDIMCIQIEFAMQADFSSN